MYAGNAKETEPLATEMVKGAIAGAVGVWAMDQVGWAMYNREDPVALQQELEARVEGKDPADVAAGKMAEMVGVTLTPEQPHPAGIAVHYALGIVPGAAYGALRHSMPGLTAGHGLLYGLGLFLLHDEGLAPALGLASGPMQYPRQAHARGLVSHLVLGAVTDAVLNILDEVQISAAGK